MSAKSWDVSDRLGEMQVPVLAACGRFDETAVAEHLTDCLPGAEVRVARTRATPDQLEDHQLETIVKAFAAPAEDDAAFRDAWIRIMPVYFHRYRPEWGEQMNDQMQFSAAGINRVVLGCFPGSAHSIA